jgi:hypothetical protein
MSFPFHLYVALAGPPRWSHGVCDLVARCVRFDGAFWHAQCLGDVPLIKLFNGRPATRTSGSMASSSSKPDPVARMPAVGALTLAKFPPTKAWRSKLWSTSPLARRGVSGATIRCTPSALVTVAALPMPTSWVAAWLIGVVDPYRARWSRAITSTADAALRACLLRTLNTPMSGAARP